MSGNHRNRTPAYKRIQSEIRDHIAAANLRPGDAVASERELAKTLLAIALLAEALLANALLTKSKAATLHRPVLRLRLALQHSHDLRHDRQDLSHHFIDILLAQLAWHLAVSGVSHCSMR